MQTHLLGIQVQQARMIVRAQNHITLAQSRPYCPAFMIWPDTRVIERGTTLDSVCDGLATKRRNTFPTFLQFCVVGFWLLISGTDIPLCMTPCGAELPSRNLR